MFENKARGWHGAFSTVGRNSAEKYHIIIHKDDIMKKRTKLETQQLIVNFLKRNNYSNIENDRENLNTSGDISNDNQLDALEDNIDIFQLDKNEQKLNKNEGAQTSRGKNKNNFNNRNCRSATHRLNPEIYKYHDKHMKEGIKKKNDTQPTCTKYNPKRDFVWKRTITGPAWNTIKGRTNYYKNDNSKYYLGQEDPLAHSGKAFIVMSKQSARGDFVGNNNVRFVNTKPFIQKQVSKRPRSSTNSYTTSSIGQKEEVRDIMKITPKAFEINSTKKNHPSSGRSMRPMSVTTNYSSRPMTTNPTSNRLTSGGPNINSSNNVNSSHLSSKSNHSRDPSISSSSQEDSYENFKYIYQKQFKKRPQTALISPQNNISGRRKSVMVNSKKLSTNPNKNKTNIKAPDFRKAISREYLDQLNDKKTSLIPFSLPNFKQVRERPIMMVVYDRKRHHRKKPKEMKGIEPSLYYDPDKMLNKVNNHTEVHAPKFDMMSSRPDDDNPLPSYMKKVYSRECAYSITDQTLKMNNYAEGKFRTNYTSFWPKKSFNKIVNLNLLNSDQFIENAFGNKKELEKGNDYIAKSMKFYHKNYDDLMKESLLSRFDNVTYKTIKKENKLDQKDVEKFLKNFENINEIPENP